MWLIRSTDAEGSRMTVYLPGSIAFASRERAAFSAAMAETGPVFSFFASL